MRAFFSKVQASNNRWLGFLVGGGKGRDTTAGGQDGGSHASIPARRKGADSARDKPIVTTWAESLVFAGSSALLLLVANLFSHYWYVCLFSLTPLLFRVIQAAPAESLRLGFLFGLSFFGASAVDSLGSSPFSTVFRSLSGTTLFAVFGWSVGRARQRWGFNPSIVALLWAVLEMGLLKLGFTHGLLAQAQLSQPLCHSLVGLFGLLAASAVIVLLNSLLVLAIVETIRAARINRKAPVEDQRKWSFFFTRTLVAEKVYLVPEDRAPPSLCILYVLRSRGWNLTQGFKRIFLAKEPRDGYPTLLRLVAVRQGDEQ
jgi:hypothetical protein